MAVIDDSGTVIERQLEAGSGIAESIVPLLAELLKQAEVALNAVDRLAVVTGPGGFTGVRAAVAVVRALALATDRQVDARTALELVAARLTLDEAEANSTVPSDTGFLVLADAQRGDVVAQRFARDGASLGPPEIGAPAALVQSLAPASSIYAIQPLDWARSAPRWTDLLPPERLADVHLVAAPTAGDLVRVARRAALAGVPAQFGFDVAPFYVRPPDARPGAGASLVVAS